MNRGAFFRISRAACAKGANQIWPQTVNCRRLFARQAAPSAQDPTRHS
jgi:hypothetical protein